MQCFYQAAKVVKVFIVMKGIKKGIEINQPLPGGIDWN